MTSPWPASAVFGQGRLVGVGGVDVDQLVDGWGTPLYVLDRAELEARVTAYRTAFGPDVRIVYAVKALGVVGVLQLLVRHGLWLDVASEGELRAALVAGAPPDTLVLHGNNKSDDELALAVRVGVARIVLDDLAEIGRVAAIAAQVGAGPPTPVWLRVTPGIQAETHTYVATGQDDSKFGLTLSTGVAHEAVRRVLAVPTLSLRGVHCHIGSQIRAVEAFPPAAELLVRLLADVRDEHGLVLDELDVGGGLGIAYREGEVTPDLDAYADGVRTAVRRACDEADLEQPTLFVEPGRSLVGPAGVALYRVGVVKDIPGTRTYVAVDGGMSDNLRPALYGAEHQVRGAGAAASGVTDTEDRAVTLVGKHCESGDVLARAARLPASVAPGDLVAVAATGAYTHAMASNYNRLTRPAMVLVDDGAVVPLVRRETVDDVLARDVPLPREAAATPR